MKLTITYHYLTYQLTNRVVVIFKTYTKFWGKGEEHYFSPKLRVRIS